MKVRPLVRLCAFTDKSTERRPQLPIVTIRENPEKKIPGSTFFF